MIQRLIKSLVFILLTYVRADMLKCMNFYGLETQRMGLVCDWAHPFQWYLDRLVKDLGVNTIRLPFSYELFKYHPLDLMDNFVRECKTRNIRVILDWHRTWNTHQGPVPEEGIDRSEFINTWIKILERYPDVYGIGIFNEIQTDDFDYANNLHKEVITAIEQRFPGKFVYFAGCPRWGGDCHDMKLDDMPTWNRTYIEVHKYIFSGASDLQDWEKSIPRSIPSDHWFVGEVGWKQEIQKEREWAERFLAYLNSRNITNVCAWTIAHSGDTEGWWKDDCETFQWDKAALLRSFWVATIKQVREFTSYVPIQLHQPLLPLLRGIP